VTGVALVTGAARGIGLETVRGLAAAGMDVVLGARDVVAGEAARAGLGELGDRVAVVRLDVTDPGTVASCVAAIETAHGRLDVLVNNGGVNLDRDVSVLDADFAVVRETLETNLFGAWRLTLAALGLLRAGAPSRVINVSSGMGQLDDMRDGSAGYRISKLALNGVTRMMGVALAGDGVSVVSVCPGWVLTEMGGDGAYLSIEEGADTILWLATVPAGEVPTGAFYKRRAPIPW
jgi:NAD(P)-dependent dehydrogenase (short-subunit alcohol dehydrogenase family)